MSVIAPNLFVIGAMKSGTSSLHTYLGEHPSIFMCDPKEPEHFGHWTMPYAGQDQRLKDAREYLRLFEKGAGAEFRGDASTSYTKLPQYVGAAESIWAFNRNARLIYIMRDPVERVISHYWHMVRHGVETRSILESVQEAVDGKVPEAPQYISISHYAMQLEAFFDYFDPDQIMALTLERLKADPTRGIQEIYAWLGVDAQFVPPSIHRRVHVTPDRLRVKRRSSLVLNMSRSGLWSGMRSVTPPPIRRLGRKAIELVARIPARRPIDRASMELVEVKQLLRPIQMQQTRQLSRLLSRDFLEWTTLHGND